MARGRPTKQGLDYFPLDVHWWSDDKIMVLRSRCGIEGEVSYLRLLSDLYSVGCCYRWGEVEAVAFSMRHHLALEPLKGNVQEMLNLGLFSASVYSNTGFLTCKAIQRRYLDIIKATHRVFNRVPEGVWLLDENLPQTPSLKLKEKEKEKEKGKSTFVGIKSEEIRLSSEENKRKIGQNSEGTHTHTPQDFESRAGKNGSVKQTPIGRAVEFELRDDQHHQPVRKNSTEGKYGDFGKSIEDGSMSFWSESERAVYKKLEESQFEPPTDQDWTRSSVFIATGKRPMKKYPLIWITPVHLYEVNKILHQKLPLTHHREVFIKCQSKVQKYVEQGRRPENCDSQSWLTGFCLTEVLNQFNEEI